MSPEATQPAPEVLGQEYWDSIAQDWPRRHRQSLWRKYCDALHADLVRRFLAQNLSHQGQGRVLKTDLFDEAVGEGLLGEEGPLASWASSVTGIDISECIVKQAADKNPGLRALVADVRRLPFADKSFDLVLSNSTLDHFARAEDIHVALRELHRVLRQGGQLILTMDNPANPAVWLRNNLPLGWLGRLGVVPYFVGATMGRRQLARALTDVGLYVHVSTAIMHCLRMPAVAVCDYLDKRASAAVGKFWTRRLAESEWLGRLPTRYVTGCFVAIDARKERPD